MTEEDIASLSPLGQAAVWYCQNGFAIVPLNAHGKRPATANGLNDWFDNPQSAYDLWSKCPNFNIGIICGSPSHGLLVFDLDVDENKDGIETLRKWQAAHGELPETAMAETGGGGRHYLFRTNRTNIRPSTNAELGVDIRCDGSYIVAPPSVHPSGALYTWWEDPRDTPVATANAAVYDFLDHVVRNGGMDEDRPQGKRFQLPERIRKGERNDVLYRYGCSLRVRGYADDAIDAMVRKEAANRCDEPMSEGELKSVIRQACKHGPGHNGEGTMRDDTCGLSAPGRSSIVADGMPIAFRNDKGKILTNLLAQNIMSLNHARYIDGALAVWNGSRWVFDKRALEYICLSYADDATSTHRTEVIKYIEVKAEKVASTSMNKGHYVQFRNCTYDAMRMCEVTPTHDMYITATLPIDLNLDAPYGDADRFLESIADSNGPTMQAMAEVIGACMCSRRLLSQSPMLIGRPTRGTSTAANGKSTYIDVIRALLGDENVTSMDITALGDRYGPAELTGKLANLGDDIPDGFLKGSELSMFKKLVTGNNIKAERKYHDPFDFKPSATMVFSMNAMPRLADTTDGVFRRLAFVPFRRTFTPSDPDFDPNIIDKLTEPATLQRFAVIGLMALHDMLADGRDRLTEIPDMVAEIEEVRIDNSVVRRWLYEEGVTSADIDRQPVQGMYEQFLRWCEEAGEKFTLKRTSFTKEVLATLGNTSVSVLLNHTSGKKERTFVVE